MSSGLDLCLLPRQALEAFGRSRLDHDLVVAHGVDPLTRLKHCPRLCVCLGDDTIWSSWIPAVGLHICQELYLAWYFDSIVIDRPGCYSAHCSRDETDGKMKRIDWVVEKPLVDGGHCPSNEELQNDPANPLYLLHPKARPRSVKVASNCRRVGFGLQLRCSYALCQQPNADCGSISVKPVWVSNTHKIDQKVNERVLNPTCGDPEESTFTYLQVEFQCFSLFCFVPLLVVVSLLFAVPGSQKLAQSPPRSAGHRRSRGQSAR